MKILTNGEWVPFTPYDREALVETLVYHQRKDIGACICGWEVLGASHPEHVVDQYERIMNSRVRP